MVRWRVVSMKVAQPPPPTFAQRSGCGKVPTDMLEVTALAKAFGGQSLFRNLSLRLSAGDRVGLVGPNGAGKTTLLRILVGEEHADDGVIARPRDLSVGYLPQELERTADTSVLLHTLEAAQDVLALEAEIARLEAQLASPESAHDVSELAARHTELVRRHRFVEGHTLEGRAKEILSGLGFTSADYDRPLGALSGGWGMRVELARLLLARPDVLLLDEPTNHLDLASLGWIETFLSDYPGAYLVVSHDRYFLNRMVTSVAELSSEGLWQFPGNYDDYVEARAELEAQLLREQASVTRRIAETKVFIERFKAKASKARQAQSRAKLVTKLEQELADKPALPPRQRRAIKMNLPEPVRSGDLVMSLRGAKKAYGERVVYEGLDYTIRRGERIALVGENGAGKSTLLKMLAGVLAPDAGERVVGHNVETYYFAQHQTDSLRLDRTVLAELRALLPLETETRVRGILGAFLFSGDAVDKSIAVLSGGEKSRLALAKMLARPANLLLLDEPTSHLDLVSRDVIESALADFAGTLCFISHDRYFINRLATQVVEVRSGGVVTAYPGDYEYFLWKSAAEREQRQASGEPGRAAATSEPPDVGKTARLQEREARKGKERETARRAKEAARLEGEIEAAEGRLRAIDAQLCEPTVFADPALCRELAHERQELEERVAALYASWESTSGESAPDSP